MWRISGTVDKQPVLSAKGKVTAFYLRSYRPSKSRKNIMILKIVAFGKTAQRICDLVRPQMRIECYGQITTSTYADKRYMAAGLNRDQATRWVLQLVARDFTFLSTQWEITNLAMAMDIACAEDWIEPYNRAKDADAESSEIGV